MLTLTILDQDQAALSVTEHATLTEAVREYEGWTKAGAAEYLVQGTMDLDCACKRVMESRNRLISLALCMPVLRTPQAPGHYIQATGTVEMKAPQVCKLLGALRFPANDMPHVDVEITSKTFVVGWQQR